MPMYEYRCPDCGREENRLVPMAERDHQTCSCGVAHERIEIPSGQVTRTDARWKMDAILANGQKVDGAALGRTRKHKGFM
jgi:putative FmdB family regulatory protein